MKKPKELHSGACGQDYFTPHHLLRSHMKNSSSYIPQKSGGVCSFIYNPKSYEYRRSLQEHEREDSLVVELVSEALVLAGRRAICQVTAECLTGRKTGLTENKQRLTGSVGNPLNSFPWFV